MAQFSHDSYILPASYDSVPQAFQSNKSAKPIPCSLQTTNVPALTGSAAASGTSIIQLPCGSSAGLMLSPYLRFDAAVDTGVAQFKGSTHSATAMINRLSTYINSVQIDNIQSADQVYDTLFAHATSNDWLQRDANVLMGTGVGSVTGAGAAAPAATAGGGLTTTPRTFIVPLIGALGTQQAIPLYLFNGTLQIQIDWNSVARSLFTAGAGAAIALTNVQLVYDKISVEQAFVDKVRMDMMSGQKYVLGYTNFQATTLATLAGQQTLNYGLNVSSLKGCVANQVLTADLSNKAAQGLSEANGLTQFQLSLDGRLINSNTLDASSVAKQALVFAELNKVFGRLFDASVTDSSDAASYQLQSFAVGVSAQRCNEALAFAGSPVSVASIQATTAAALYTMTVIFIADYQLLVDSSGSVEIVR